MATRGYNRYRGRGEGGGRIAWVIVLSLVLLAAVGYLVGQQYMVYDEEGRAHLELPFIPRADPEEPRQNNPVSPEEVVIERQEPEEPKPEPTPARRQLAQLHALELEYGSLWWNTDYVLSLVDEAMVIQVKRWNGGITYGTAVETPTGVVVEKGPTRDNLATLLQSDKYAVAHLVCFCDSAYAKAFPEMALIGEDEGLWYDGEGRAWLDPGSPGTLAYVTALCQECAQLGFDEIMLDAFCYGATGDPTAIDGAGDLDRTAVLADFAQALRKALPEELALSVTLRGEMGALDGPSGLTAELLGSFDRIYVDGETDLAALTEALPADFDRAGGLAVLTRSKPESGGYVLLA